MKTRTHGFFGAACLLLALSGASFAQDDGRYPTPEQAPAFREPVFITKLLDRAYPGAEYNVRPAVTGGTWPYRFALRAAPEGMAIDANTGTVTWQAPKAEGLVAQVAIALTDQAGRKAEYAYSMTVGKQGFVFVSPDGDDANPGTFEKPWKTVMRAAQPVDDPANTTLYLRGGTYVVEAPPGEGKKDANVLGILRTSPRRWIAWPGEKPVIDLGWSEEKWKAALEAERAKLDEKNRKNANTKGYGHRIYIDHQIDDLLFDGLEIKNASFYMFVMWDGNRERLTWRRCNLHHLWGDYRENSCFIFGFAPDRKFEKPAPGETFAFGKRPQSKPYRNIVVQECSFTDALGASSAGLHWYVTEGCLMEECRFERIVEDVFWDKDNGWDNTYRNNVFKGNVVLAAQGCNDGIAFHHNFVDGRLFVGWQPGWMRNIWVHHNAIRGRVRLLGGGTQGPAEEIAAEGRALAGPSDPDAQAVVRGYPRDRRLVFFWGNAVDLPAGREGDLEADLLDRVPGDIAFAKRFRYVWSDANLVDESARMGAMSWTEFAAACGFEKQGVSAVVAFDDEGRLPADSPWRARFGREAGVAQTRP